MVNRVVYKKLVEVAKSRRTIPLAEVGRIADMRPDSADDAKMLGLILDNIAAYDAGDDRPLLPVVVVDAVDSRPGAGLARYAKRKNMRADDTAFYAAELERVYDHWASAKMPRR